MNPQNLNGILTGNLFSECSCFSIASLQAAVLQSNRSRRPSHAERAPVMEANMLGATTSAFQIVVSSPSELDSARSVTSVAAPVSLADVRLETSLPQTPAEAESSAKSAETFLPEPAALAAIGSFLLTACRSEHINIP